MPHIYLNYQDDDPHSFSEKYLDINSCGYFRTRAQKVLVNRPDGLPDYLLLIITAGTMYFTINGRETAIHRGDFLIFPPETPQLFHSQAGHAFGYLWLHFSGTVAKEILASSGLVPMQLYHCSASPSLLFPLRSMAEELNRQQRQYQMKAVALFMDMLVLLSRNMDDTANARRGYEQLLPALNAMENDNCALNIAEYASLCALRVDHFSHRFKQLMGISPLQYLSERSMQKAAELLSTTDSSVAAISETLGFHDVKYFSRKFKKHYGLSPSLYRKNH